MFGMSNAKWLRERMLERDFTVADVARLSLLPVGTVERALAGNSTLLTDLTLSVALDPEILEASA